MMRRAVIVTGFVSILAVFGAFLSALDQARAETQFTLGPPPTAAIAWTSPGAWNEPGFPNASTHSANLSRPLAASLTANIGSNEITLAGLSMGSTISAVTTNIAGGGTLVFQNDDAGFNGGVPIISSLGVPGATNTISALVRLNEQLDISAASTNDLTITGVVANGTAPAIRSFLPAGLSTRVEHLDINDYANPDNFRRFFINNSAGSPPGMPAVSTQGTVELGRITGYGEISVGVPASQHPVPLGTVVFRGPNEIVGYVQLNRANVVLATDNSLGQYGIYGGQPNQAVGFNLISTDDSRVESASVELSQWFTVKGQYSLTWNGIIVQSNSRGWINLLPSGKSFNLNEGVYAVTDEDTERTLTFDGTGLTVVNGGLHDKWISGQGPSLDGTGHYRKTGTGSVVVGNNAISTYHGNTIVEAGTLRFGSAAHLDSSPAIVSTGGAVGVDSGIYSNPALLDKFDTADTGGVMLAPSEAALNLDFTSAPLAGAANSSVAAPEAGLTYTGTITPAGPNYRLGGGTGKLTLPNANQLTGNRGLTVTNGGEVDLLATHNYTGPTIVTDYAFSSRTNQAIADTITGISTALFAPTTLTVHSLANGGVAGSLGSSASAPENLVLRGSKLRIASLGPIQSTDRLFTIGARGATLETVGLARVHFSNPGSLAVEPAGPGTRTLTLAADHMISPYSRFDPIIPDAPDGGIVGVTKTGPGVWVLLGNNTYSGATHVREGALYVHGEQTGTGETVVDAGAKFGGRGSIGGSVEVAGALDVTSSFHVAGDLDFLPASEFMAGISLINQFTNVSVAGAVDLAGTFRFRYVGVPGRPYEAELGDTFTILHAAGGISGAFDQIVLPPISASLRWEPIIDSSSMLLRVVAVPEPNCLVLFALAACLLPLRRR